MMRQFAFLVFLLAVCCIEKVHGDKVNGAGEGADDAVDDATNTENSDSSADDAVDDATNTENSDSKEINAPTEESEDPSIADKVAAEEVDESQNDIDGAEQETEPQADSDEVDTFTDAVQPQPADDDDSKQETYTDTVDPLPADDTVDSDASPDADSQSQTPKESDDADSPSETSKENVASLEVNSSLSTTESAKLGKFEPYEGMEIPSFIGTFPGCTCLFSETQRRWKCQGTIAYPESVAGDECCCCTLKCQWKARCTNKQCLAIGIDQAEEVAAEEKRMRELMQGADMLIGDDLPGFITDLGKGRCDQNRILNGCKERGMTPLCDHTSYSNGGGCYSPGFPGTKFHNRHFSHWGGHRQHFGIEDDYLFYGMCFYGNNPNGLAPCNGDSHCWTNGNHRLSPNSRVLATGPVPNIHFNQISDCSGGLGCWRTICVKNSPNKIR